MKLFIYFSIIIVVCLTSCKPKFDIPEPKKGSADFTKYVALGNSITAGYADGALYYEAQENSFPAILAKQFELVGGGKFTIPFVSSGSNGISVINNNTISINAKSTLSYKTDCKDVTSLSPIRLTPNDNYNVFTTSIFNASNPFHNLGTPDAKVFHLNHKGYGNSSSSYYNAYYNRIASSTNSSIIDDAKQLNATFFSLLIGSNDVLTYALNGGASDSLTSSSRFNQHIDTILEKLTQNGAKGVIGNIPDITELPFFTTIPYNGLTLDEEKVEQLNNLYAPLGIGITFSVGANAFVIQDATAPIGFRQIKNNELILLSIPLDSVKCHNIGSLIPIPNRFVLNTTEINDIKNHINNYNLKLQNSAQAKNLAFVDVKSLFHKLKSGIMYNGININTQFVKGGAFSLDGVNLNPIGNALLANEFIKSINLTFSSRIPQVDVTKFRGVIFP
jgi:lysophospholipase L1-like esterase